MLVLSRKILEAVHVGDATITIVKIAGNRVTLGIAAPPATAIIRAELPPQASPATPAEPPRV
jgi:carbon storage regulator CsrA